MTIQDTPVCFECHERVDNSLVFEAPCGHERCPSAVFHGLCLMRWREQRQEIERFFERMRRTFMEEHTGNESERN